MTPDPGCPACPRCHSSERVEVIAPPAHDPDARFYCPTDNLAFDGSREEAERIAASDAAKARDRQELDRLGAVGRDLGVIGDHGEESQR